MNSDIKYYRSHPAFDTAWPLLSMEFQEDVTIIGYYETMSRRPQNSFHFAKVGGWLYVSYTQACPKDIRVHMKYIFKNYTEITKEEADRELFLYEL